MKTNKKIVGIVCEYNPMHNGHIYQIEKIKKELNPDFIIGVISGNFCQRSEPCIFDKYTRAKIAVENGVDLVVENPTAFCTNSGEIFATSSIKILKQLGCNYISFGMETVNNFACNELVDFLLNEPIEYKTALNEELEKFNTFSIAKQNAIKKCLNCFSKDNQNDIVSLISKPNNILGIEYLKAIKKCKAKISPFIIKRDDNYNELSCESDYISSSSIRANYNNILLLKNKIPQNVLEKLSYAHINNQKYEDILTYNVKFSQKDVLNNIFETNENTTNTLFNTSKNCNSFDELKNQMVSKTLSEKKLKTIALNLTLGITKSIIGNLYKKPLPYIKALAIKKQSKVLSVLNTKKLITRKNDAQNLKLDAYSKQIIEIQNKSNILYNYLFDTHLNENDLFATIIVV